MFWQLDNGAEDARGDDILKIRGAVANWLNNLQPPPVPLLDPDSRTQRGIQHELIGRLLCPLKLNWDDER